MEAKYEPKKFETKIYKQWEQNKLFIPRIEKGKKPFTVLLPPPNANDPLHIGHALYVIEDILCRWHRMKGEPTLFLPGTDHAGIETQYVFEKKLRKKGKSRFDYDRETLYKMIEDYVEENRGIAKEQMKKLGFSLDWTREKYTLNPEIVKTVLSIFRRLYNDGLVYREEKMVNYCPKCGTAFSNLEVEYVERTDPLYYMKYGPFVLATVRPETKFGDTAVAVHPEDKRYQDWIGKEFIYESLIGPRKMVVIADKSVDPEFGTGAVKVTPGHDPNDFKIAQRHNLPIVKVIGRNGKMNENAGRFSGLTIKEAREKVVKELEQKGEIVKIEKNYVHRVGTCYRCGTVIEPTLMPQWFIKIKPLAEPAIEAVKKNKVGIFPERFKKLYLNWMENIYDWNISRQIVWGPRIPAWYCLECNPSIEITFIDKAGKNVSGTYLSLKNDYSFAEIKKGLQSLIAPKEATYFLEKGSCPQCHAKKVLQETDTFDTWFSSGQWPLTTLGYPNGKDFQYFYPTSVLDTMWDILFFWVARMIMFGLYLTNEVPFEMAHMHCRVVDKSGQKMSKSKGNVIDPIEVCDKYGTDALRMALVFGASPGSDICLSDDKFKAMRNFTNKVWNAARFIYILAETEEWKIDWEAKKTKEDEAILKESNRIAREVNRQLENYRFGLALERIYEFFWHSFCDQYIEKSKSRPAQALPTLFEVLIKSLKLLHPFAPFVTEAIYQELKAKAGKNNFFDADYLAIASWPTKK